MSISFFLVVVKLCLYICKRNIKKDVVVVIFVSDSEWAIVCCLAPSQQHFIYIINGEMKILFDEMIIMFTNTPRWGFKVLAYREKSVIPQVDMLCHDHIVSTCLCSYSLMMHSYRKSSNVHFRFYSTRNGVHSWSFSLGSRPFTITPHIIKIYTYAVWNPPFNFSWWGW